MSEYSSLSVILILLIPKNRYPEVQDVEVAVLMAHLPNLKQELSNMLRTACDGSRPHASTILQKIIYRLDYSRAPTPHAEAWPDIREAPINMFE